MGMQWRQEREERQKEGKALYVTKDMSWIHSNIVNTWYACWPTEAAGQPQEVWICGLFLNQSSAAGRNLTAGKWLKTELEAGRGGIIEESQMDSCVYQTLLYQTLHLDL